jgi:hypothetical protein
MIDNGDAVVTTLDTKDKITILLAEYNALRAQLLQRNTIINQIFTISGTVLLALITLVLTQSIRVGIGLAVILVPVLLFTFRLNESDMLVSAKRLEELRIQINEMASETLLKAETAAGESTMGYIPNFPYAVQPLGKIGLLLRRLWRRRTGV